MSSAPAVGADATRRLLIRYGGEVTTKGPATRKRFIQRLCHNLMDALEAIGCEGKIQRDHNRLFIEVRGEGDVSSLAHVFGIQSMSVVDAHPWTTLDDLVEIGVALFSDAVRDRRFAVRARRVGDRSRIAVDRVELERALGTRLLPLSRGVDLDRPEASVHIEVMPGNAYFFTETFAGPGGLPLGVEGRGVSLMSGGFDSAVATWQLMRRGVDLDFVFCNLGGRAHQLEALRVMKVLADEWAHGSHPHLHAIDFDPISRDLQANTETRYWQVILKRLMLRAAELVARERNGIAIVTGDAVGQVSSQTLQNLAVISQATTLPILRPLVGCNKNEILEIARNIGTYETSKTVGEYCALVPRKPATSASLSVVKAEETRLSDGVLERLVSERAVFDLRRLNLESLASPEIETREISPGSTVLDLRSKAAFQSWHYPDALYLDFANAMRVYPEFDLAGDYVFYCEFGLKSAHLAELMTNAGFRARHFSGGLKQLIGYARARGLSTPEV